MTELTDEITEPTTDDLTFPATLPVLPLKDTVVFPGFPTPLAIGQERSIKLIDDVAAGERLLALVTVKNDDRASTEAATRLHDELEATGVDVLLDDRDERGGVKFNDADLLGIPLRVTIGPRGLASGMIELKARSAAAPEEIPFEGGAAEIAKRIRTARAELSA